MTDIYDEMYHLRNQRDAMARRAWECATEADRLRDQLRAEQDNAQRRIDELQAQADRLREALRAVADEYEPSDEPIEWDEHDEPWEYAAARVTAAVNRIALAARDALNDGDGGGLTEIARISADADLYQRTDGVVIRREENDR